MSDSAVAPKPARPPLPRDSFRGQRASGAAAGAPAPVVVTPDYGDEAAPRSPISHETEERHPAEEASPRTQARGTRAKPVSPRNPFDAYGERSSSRPYALRLPDAIDLVVRQMAAEERTHPLRVIDRILHEHLKRTGRLPPPRGT